MEGLVIHWTDKYIGMTRNNLCIISISLILGCGTLICFIIVTPMILLAYAVEGRKNIQATSLDALFSFAGACMLIAVGGKINN